nr:CoA transferase [Acidiferrobacterales bacterium]
MAIDQSKPLEGIRVLDLTNVLSGPYCCYQLALMGAEVIKVENPQGGDLARQLGADEQRSQERMGISFLAQNAGKKSITLNLKSPRGQELFIELVKTADVLVENFRPGVMKRLGFGYPVLQQQNLTLIYAAISGFGQTGPLSQRPAYDQIVQGLSGVMSITGDADSAPLRVGYPLADTVGGMAAAFAIAAALNNKPRGCYIDVSMLESLISTMGWVVSNYLIGGEKPSPHGNENVTSAPSGAFRTATGLLNIAANKEEQWQSLASHLGLSHLLDDSRFATRTQRRRYREELTRLIESVLVLHSAEEWERELNAIGVPAGRVLNVEEALASKQLLERGMLFKQRLTASEEEIDLVGSPFMVDQSRPAVDIEPPMLGADNEA